MAGKVAGIVVGVAPVFTFVGARAGRRRDEIPPPQVIDVAVAVVVDAGGAVALGGIDPQVGGAGQATEIRMVGEDAGVQDRDDDGRVARVDVPGFERVQVPA